MKVLAPLCLVLLIASLPTFQGSNQPSPKIDFKVPDKEPGKEPSKEPPKNDDPSGKEPFKQQPLPNDVDWKGKAPGKEPNPNKIFGKEPLPNGGDDWKFNQPLPSGDLKDILHSVFGDSPPDSHNGNSGGGNNIDRVGQAISGVEDLVNKIVTNVQSLTSKSNLKKYCQSNTTKISDLEQSVANETRLLDEATKNAKNEYILYQNRLKAFTVRQLALSTTKDTLLQLLNIDSDPLSVYAIANHLQSNLQGLSDQYNISLIVLNSTLQSLNATLIQTCSQSYQNRLSALKNRSISLDNDYQNLQTKIAGISSDLDTSKMVLKTLLDLYNQSTANLTKQVVVFSEKINSVTTGVVLDVEVVRKQLIGDPTGAGKIVIDFSYNLLQLHPRIISSNGTLRLDVSITLHIILVVDHENLTKDGITEFETEIKKFIIGLSVYEFLISRDNVNVTKTETKKRDGSTGGKVTQQWVASFNQSKNSNVPGVDPTTIDQAQFSGKATNDTNDWISEISKKGDLTDKINEISSSIDKITISNKIFQITVDAQYQNYLKWQNNINQEIDSYAGFILGDGQNEVEIATAVFNHLACVINSTKINVVYQLYCISGSLMDANLTVLQIELNITQCIDQMNDTTDPDTLATLQIQKQVLTFALTQALKTLAILQSVYDNGTALLSNLDYQLSKAENETSDHIQRIQKKEYCTINEIRQNWKQDEDAIRQQFRTSLESLLNCTVDQDSIGGLDDNDTSSLSLQWTFHFNLSSGESDDSKILILKTVIPNLVAVTAIVSIDSIQVTVTSGGSKRAAGDLTAQASVSPSSPSSSTSSSTNQPASSNLPLIIGCAVGAAALVVILIVVVIIVKKRRPDERV